MWRVRSHWNGTDQAKWERDRSGHMGMAHQVTPGSDVSGHMGKGRIRSHENGTTLVSWEWDRSDHMGMRRVRSHGKITLQATLK